MPAAPITEGKIIFGRFRRRGLDRRVYDAWRRSLTAIGDTAGQILGWAHLEDGGICIASRGLLSVRPAADPGDSTEAENPTEPAVSGWRHVGWHRIERGAFDGDTRTLHWTGYDGTSERVVLTSPGRVPPVFRERVAASIAVEEFIPLDPEKQSGPGVVISGRRDLGESDTAIEWHATPTRGTDWNTPGVRELAAAATLRLRAEYDPAE